MEEGRVIVDIGPSKEEPLYPACSSIYYCMELAETAAYPLLVRVPWPS